MAYSKILEVPPALPRVQGINLKKHPGQKFEGRYLSFRMVTSKKFGNQQAIWKFESRDGEPFEVYGFGHLDKLMKLATTGKFYLIGYEGQALEDVRGIMKHVHKASVVEDDGVN